MRVISDQTSGPTYLLDYYHAINVIKYSACVGFEKELVSYSTPHHGKITYEYVMHMKPATVTMMQNA